MARYVIASRRAGKFRESEKVAARSAMDLAVTSIAHDLHVVGENNPPQETDRRVMIVDADPSTVDAIAGYPDVLVEPEIIHWPATFRPTDFVDVAQDDLNAPVQPGDAVNDIRVTGSGAPLPGSEVLLFLRGFGGINRTLREIADDNGEARFTFPPFFHPSALLVIPPGDHWTMVVRAPSAAVEVDCLPLPEDGPFDWWHEIVRLGDPVAGGGSGIRVGVIDTGVGPHPHLGHVTDAGAFIDGGRSGAGGDVDSHGTHVCGTIGARPAIEGEYQGIAADVDLFSARVFPEGQGANQGDIANAIDELSRVHHVDLINLSLGAEQGSQIELDAIRDALERGTSCVCAAANTAAAVNYPAAFAETIAVSALGLLGAYPDGSLSATRVPDRADRFGDENLYLANFSSFGPQVDCAAPGVGIIAPVPARHGLETPYAAMDGTSMASPVACAALAILLSQSPDYANLDRDETRHQLARQLLRQHCRDIDLADIYQGRGVPTV